MNDLEKLKMLRNRRMEQQFIELQTQRQILDGWHNQIFSKQQQITEFKQWISSFIRCKISRLMCRR